MEVNPKKIKYLGKNLAKEVKNLFAENNERLMAGEERDARIFVTYGLQHASLAFTISLSLLKLMSIDSVCHPSPLSSVAPSPPAFSLSPNQGLF